MDMLLRGGLLFDVESLERKDVLIRNGVVATVGNGLELKGAEVFSVADCIISPGFIDLHVHLREPGFENKETMQSGTTAAAAGGFTTVCAMPNLKPVPDNREHLDCELRAIKSNAKVRVLPYAALTVNEKGEHLADISALAPHVCGFSDDGRGLQEEGIMRRAMEKIADTGCFVAAHCEVESLLPRDGVCVHKDSRFAIEHGWEGCSSESEYQEVERDIRLAAETGCRLHICHTSTEESFDLVRRAKALGLPVTCEATPHNLLLSCDDIDRDSGKYRMNPPLRSKKDVLAAQKSLIDGTIDAIATDHAPHTDAEKLVPFQNSANGVVGLETAFAACYTGLVKTGIIPLEKLLYLLTTGPQIVLGGGARRLSVGDPADITVLDLQLKQQVDPATFCSRGRATPFEGAELWGWPVLTMVGGAVVYRR